MAKSTDTDTIARAVMRDIADGKVTMRSRTYYTLLSGLVAATVIAAGTALAYVSSIAYFWVRISNSEGMAYGARARLSDSLAQFPWWLVIVAVALGAAAVWLVRQQGRFYKHRVTTIILGLAAASLLLAVLLASLNVGQPYAQQHVPRMQQSGQGPPQGRGMHRPPE